jgi:hypothetical protein
MTAAAPITRTSVGVYLDMRNPRQWRRPWESYRRHGAEGTRYAPAPFDVGDFRVQDGDQLPGFLLATPEDAAAALSPRLDGLPVAHIFFWADLGGVDPGLVAQHLELTAKFAMLVSDLPSRPSPTRRLSWQRRGLTRASRPMDC